MKTKDWRGGLQTTITNTTYLTITRLRRGVPPRLCLLVCPYGANQSESNNPRSHSKVYCLSHLIYQIVFSEILSHCCVRVQELVHLIIPHAGQKLDCRVAKLTVDPAIARLEEVSIGCE
jgi:hypothetical protein